MKEIESNTLNFAFCAQDIGSNSKKNRTDQNVRWGVLCIVAIIFYRFVKSEKLRMTILQINLYS